MEDKNTDNMENKSEKAMLLSLVQASFDKESRI